MADLILSPQQAAVIDWVRNGQGSLNLIARAGCGKTSTLMEMAKVIKGQAFMGAFNKAIADEFKERLAKQKSFHVTGGTIHSAGFSAWKRIEPRAKVEASKVKNLARSKFAWDRKLQQCVVDAVGYAKQGCFGVEGCPKIDDTQAWTSMIEYYDIMDEIPAGIMLDTFIGHCQQVYQASLDLCDVEIDFDDMLLAPLYFKAPMRKYDWVLIDEAQDTNAARRLIAFAMMHPGSRMVAVGDPAQAIYGFAGADSDAMDLIKTALGSIEMPLSVTYRCPKNVVRLANEWVPDIEAHETAPNGLVTNMEHTALWRQDLDFRDVVLCRNTRPLVGIARRLRNKVVPCVVEGQGGKGLRALAEKWGSDLSIDAFLDHLDAYEDAEVKKWTLKDKGEKADAVTDKCGTLRDLCQSLEGRTTRTLIEQIDYLFAEKGQMVLRLCTIHRSKGREWNRVYLVGRNRYQPSVWAKKDWEMKQEDNLAYVAVTRAKVELVEVEVPFKKKDEREWWEA